jgi:hypothetical protein
VLEARELAELSVRQRPQHQEGCSPRPITWVPPLITDIIAAAIMILSRAVGST